MKKKSIVAVFVIVAVLIAGIVSAFFAGCSKEEEFPAWNISGGIRASFSDNGNYGFILTVDGSGKMRDYASAKDTPWYGKSGRVTDVVISNGITYIGSNSFTNCAIKEVVLPESVTAIGEKVFPESCKVYARSHVTAADGREIIIMGQDATPKTYKILFIGNSYTYYNAVPVLFKKVAQGAGVDVDVTAITTGSQNFGNWADASNSDGARVEAALNSASDYNFVVLQEQSFRPLSNYSGFLSGAKALANKINATQKSCKIIMYETWGNPQRADQYGGTIPAMEARLRTAYEQVASEIGATVSYVGKAFTYIYETYDLATQGKASDMWLYQDDDTHPTYVGSYLSACVHAATILNIDPKTSIYNGEVDDELIAAFKAMWDSDYAKKYKVGLDEKTANLIKEIAYNIVFNSIVSGTAS